MNGSDAKCSGIPPFQDHPLELHISQFTAREYAPRITSLTDGSFDEGVEITATLKLVLYAQPTCCTEITRPLSVDLAFEVEGVLFVGDVSRHDDENEGYPKKESVYRKECAVVEKDTCPAEEGCDDSECRGQGGNDKFRSIANPYDISFLPNIEPGHKADNHGTKRIS